MRLVRFAFIGSILIFTLACGKNFQVKSPPSKVIPSQEAPLKDEKREESVEDIGQFYRVKRSPKTFDTRQAKNVKIAQREYKIERERLKFANMSYDFKEGRMLLRGQVLLNDQLENIEMSGKIENDIVDLKLVDPNSPFQDRLKARATCYSLSRDEKGQCQRFFIDFYYYDQGVFYTEQLIPKLEPLIKDGKKEEKPREEMTENDEVGTSEPGFFSVQNDQDIIELYPEIQSLPTEPITPEPVRPQPDPSPEVPPTPTRPQQPAPRPTPAPGPQKPPAKQPAKKSRPTNQAVGGLPGEVPALRNASNLLEVLKNLGETAGFRLVNQINERYYGTWDMVEFIKTMAAWTRVNGPGGQPLLVGNISSKEGGEQVSVMEDGTEIKVHGSHQNGLDVDIAYFTRDNKKTMTQIVDFKANKVSSSLMVDEQLKLFKHMISTDSVNIIIVDRTIKAALCKKATELGEINGNKDNPLTVKTFNRLVPDRDPKRLHGNHFHVRLFCGKYNRSCFQNEVADQGMGCER